MNVLAHNRYWSVAEGLELSRFHLTGAYPRHLHEEAIVVLVVTGAESVETSDQVATLHAGTGLVLEPHLVHRNRCLSGGVSYRTFSIRTALPDPRARLRARELDDRQFRLLLDLHHAIELDYSDSLKDNVYREIGCIFDDRWEVDKSPAWGYVVQAKRILETTFAQPLSLHDLASRVGVSPTHLAMRFREQVGIPPAAYREALRVSRARQLIREGMPLGRVAATCGFADQSHFTRRFSRLMGQTPGAYAAS